MTKKTKKFTVPEFKTWLEGIMQFQNEDWSPNREQWEEIYSKIMDLKEPVNKEKISLTEGCLDEINNIVYYHITDTLKKNFPQPPQQLQPQQLQPQQLQPQQLQPQQLQPSTADQAGLENVSLSELKRRAEEQANSVGAGNTNSHKLPDLPDSSGIPEDYV